MLDAVTKIINRTDAEGRYFASKDFDEVTRFFATGEARLRAASTISANAASILRESAAALFTEQPDLLRPGGNAYTSRRYAACVRDMEYFLRYATYALVAGDTSVIDERVLNGLKETYMSLGVPIPSTVAGVTAMKGVVASMIGSEANVYFDHIAKGLS
ncbi:allophycocyanin subunit beta [Anthocerotibacter panamensis]|uniref:ApcB1 n=1 Tax=Anthocerotibacter panamensis TaxID=2857077 RepID=A0AAJ6N6F2_9CYAN|nr:allophycocyanin subunit beta [Anthocerotibacter panamensis]8IMK_G Chain G, ApcB1 [Anthocerotibacter panamensis]8IMK_H Chain H, ApcB1 [Anthocerotibacter panamensis]8IMK_I Chain I, ApcB1 [Anthocerotibacter panamensis]8IMK_T Chain T, ApcB1 [Anthocerotibacter panamensis]8IMK_U Chain U, ApcB1 [Anthocerotibacter panamensis]8IMK_V Chain V, ApcB1 [Anthocerotibacter panamensis]8IMK_W Chain W, ApcB1 [Anthocerotibacter panamensis]8IMK_X Chain X, ApcB1 [Anthocerotibacter panamensis]8IMK_Y Chain Y, 